MTFLAYSLLSGSCFNTRMKVKVFKSELERKEWLEKNDNGPNLMNLPHWLIPDANDVRWYGVTKSGTYIFVGGRYQNIKSIDPSVLAHCR